MTDFKTTPSKKHMADESLIHGVKVHAGRAEEEGWHSRAIYGYEIADRYEILLERATAILEMANAQLPSSDEFVQFVYQHLTDAIEGREPARYTGEELGDLDGQSSESSGAGSREGGPEV